MVSDARVSGGANSQSAARFLIILDRLGESPAAADFETFPDTVKVVRATSRLVKLDFWMRNPDFLANEVLNDVEAGFVDPQVGLNHVARMLDGEVPKIHLYPMQKYKYGAWELPDNAFAVLKYLGLADQKRVRDLDEKGAARARRDYFLFSSGAARVAEMREKVDQTQWYDLQADAIALLSIGSSGAAAKSRQYEQADYASTPLGTTIAPILEQVVERFVSVANEFDFSVPTGVAF